MTRRDRVVGMVRRWLTEADGMDPERLSDPEAAETPEETAATTLRECAAEVMRMFPDVFDLESSTSSQHFIDTGAYLLSDGSTLDEAAR